MVARDEEEGGKVRYTNAITRLSRTGLICG